MNFPTKQDEKIWDSSDRFHYEVIYDPSQTPFNGFGLALLSIKMMKQDAGMEDFRFANFKDEDLGSVHRASFYFQRSIKELQEYK